MRRRHSWIGLAFALVFLPPRKEMEDWGGSFSTKEISSAALQPKPESSSSSAVAPSSASSRFSFNGIDKLRFALSPGQKPEWEMGLPPVEFYKTWDGGAWSGLSLSTRELHHFYVRAHRRGPEPKYRVYSLGPDWELIDFNPCDGKTVFLFERSLKNKKNYRVTRIKMLNSQELKREGAWELELDDAPQELLNLKSLNCTKVDLEGWPKSFRVQLE